MKLALGTAQFGLPYGVANTTGKVRQFEVAKIMARARESGIDLLDTAISYGDSEESLGAAGVGGFKVVTKLPRDIEGDVGMWVTQHLNTSLRRLGVDAVYGLLLHRSTQLLGPDGQALAKILLKLKAEGIVSKIGVSIYAPDELDAVTQICAIDIVQAPFNLFDQRLMTSGWLPRLHNTGIEVHVRSAFLQGLLLMPRSKVPEVFLPWSALIDKWHLWLADGHSTAVQACLAFVNNPMIDRVVVGIDSLAQLNEILNASTFSPVVKPPDLACNDANLINPSNWNFL
jgi:aryl-alcohol dehydrogenase-like predicted oxidoreductase